MNKWSTLFQFRNYSLRTKLLLSILVITGLAVMVFGYFFYIRTQQSQSLLDSELKKTVRQQSEQQLLNTVVAESRFSDQSLSNVTFALQQLADYQTSLYSQRATLASGTYWNGAEKLFQLSGGQIGNPKTDISSVFIPNYLTLTDAMVDDINLNIYLDFSAPAVLSNAPNVVGLYFISEQGYTIYYPNIELATIAPPDFDPRTQPYFISAMPQNNPEGVSNWIAPYQDTAGAGLIVTSSVPVYDNRGVFQGALGADVQLTTIAQNTSAIKVGESGFAFMVDKEGHIISLPEAGYQLFGVQPEEVPSGETPTVTIFGKGPAELQAATSEMEAGNQGIATVNIQDTSYYLAYAPLPTTGYSLGLIVPVAELDEPYINTRTTIENETQRTLTLAAIILGAILLVASGVSLVLSQNISRPLVKLTEIAGQVSTGRLDIQAPVETSDEIGNLAQTFNNMSAQLRESFSNLEQRVEERTQALATVSEISTAASTILDIDQLLKEVVELSKERFGLYHSHIYLMDEARENLVLASGAGEPGRQMVAQGRSISLKQERSLVARAARERQGVTVNDVTQEPDFLPNPLLPETRSELAVPMMVGENVIGVFDVQSDLVGRFSEADIAVQTTLASQIASAVQNARLFSQAEASKQEAQSLLDFAAEGIAILDLETELWAEPNENFAAVFGMTREEMVTTGPKIMSPPRQPDGRDSTEKAIEMINTAMEKGSHRFEWVHLTAQGKEFDCEIGLVRLPGKRPRLRQSILDITERKRLEEMTRRRARQQETLNLITQKIQSTTSVEDALKITARELGHALGKKPTLVALEPESQAGKTEKAD